MRIQKTVREMQHGGLYLVATPIGNLDDITLRAVKILREVDYILAEDTRVTKKLCQHLAITKRLVSFHEHNQYEKAQEVMADIANGSSIALVSDAGMPCISDPGAILVSEMIAANLAVTVIPGASASTALFSLSGMSEQGRFLFHGFLPTKEKAKRDVFSQYAHVDFPIIFYESPHRIVKTLQLLPTIFGADAQVSIGRELTKLHETLIWGSTSEFAVQAELIDTWKGEIAFIVHPAEQKPEMLTDEAVVAQIATMVEKGIKPKVAMRELSQTLSKTPNELYKLWEAHKEKM